MTILAFRRTRADLRRPDGERAVPCAFGPPAYAATVEAVTEGGRPFRGRHPLDAPVPLEPETVRGRELGQRQYRGRSIPTPRQPIPLSGRLAPGRSTGRAVDRVCRSEHRPARREHERVRRQCHWTRSRSPSILYDLRPTRNENIRQRCLPDQRRRWRWRWRNKNGRLLHTPTCSSFRWKVEGPHRRSNLVGHVGGHDYLPWTCVHVCAVPIVGRDNARGAELQIEPSPRHAVTLGDAQ